MTPLPLAARAVVALSTGAGVRGVTGATVGTGWHAGGEAEGLLSKVLRSYPLSLHTLQGHGGVLSHWGEAWLARHDGSRRTVKKDFTE